jgi:DNA ligase-1
MSDNIFLKIENIAASSGTNAKKDLLTSDMIPYLKAAYDPYTNYYAKRKETYAVTAQGDGEFDDDTWDILRRLSTRELTGLAAQKIIDNTIRNMTRNSARLFIRILNKDLRMGLAAKSINSVFDNIIPIHKIMLAYRIQWNRVTYPCWVSKKIDGVRAIYKNKKFYSRKGIPYEGLDRIAEALDDFVEPIDGELTVPIVSFQVGSGMIRNDEPTPNAVFHVFELPTIAEPFKTRISMMASLWGEDDFPVRYVPQYLCHSKKEVLRLYKVFRDCGYEGAIVRPFDYKYVGSRSYNWMKVKPLMKDLELKVIGVYEGEGKYAGMLGGVITEYFGSKGRKEVNVGSGFTDEQREFFWKCSNVIMYRYIQAEAMEETDDGSLRHPIFKEVKDG